MTEPPEIHPGGSDPRHPGAPMPGNNKGDVVVYAVVTSTWCSARADAFEVDVSTGRRVPPGRVI